MVREIVNVWAVHNPELAWSKSDDEVKKIEWSNIHYHVHFNDGRAILLPMGLFAAELSKEFDDPDVVSFDERLRRAVLEDIPEEEVVA